MKSYHPFSCTQIPNKPIKTINWTKNSHFRITSGSILAPVLVKKYTGNQNMSLKFSVDDYLVI